MGQDLNLKHKNYSFSQRKSVKIFVIKRWVLWFLDMTPKA